MIQANGCNNISFRPVYNICSVYPASEAHLYHNSVTFLIFKMLPCNKKSNLKKRKFLKIINGSFQFAVNINYFGITDISTVHRYSFIVTENMRGDKPSCLKSILCQDMGNRVNNRSLSVCSCYMINRDFSCLYLGESFCNTSYPQLYSIFSFKQFCKKFFSQDLAPDLCISVISFNVLNSYPFNL